MSDLTVDIRDKGMKWSAKCAECGKEHSRKFPTWRTYGHKRIKFTCSCGVEQYFTVDVR